MSTSNLFFKGCFSELTEEQKAAVEAVNAEGDLIDESCARETNSCGKTISQLFNEYELYDFQRGVLYKSWGDVEFPWQITETTNNLNYSETREQWSVATYIGITSYYIGDRVLYIEDDGYVLSLYEANENIPAPAGPLDRTKWTKICSVESSEPVGLPSIKELIDTYEFYYLKEYLEDWGEAESTWNTDLQPRDSDEWDDYKIRRDFFYKMGDFVLIESQCSDAFCLWINIRDIPVTDENLVKFAKFSPVVDGVRYWEKIYCVNSGQNKCLGPQSDRNLENYQFVQIGSEGHYVEQPIPNYKLKGKYLCDTDNFETLGEAAQIRTRAVLTQEEIDNLEV